MSQRVLIAGIGNIFRGDDGFGIEVVRRLGVETLPEWVRIVDFGVRTLHLAFEILDGYTATILVDATTRGEPPGTVYLIEPEEVPEQGVPDAHGMDFRAVLQLANSLSEKRHKIYVVGCEPLEVREGIGLSTPVACAVNEALRLIHKVLEGLCPSSGPRQRALPS